MIAAPCLGGGRAWQASTIYGWAERRSGILRSDLYAGQLIWNKTRMVKDPETGRRVSRPNPADQWQRNNVPHLRIVDQELWDRVQAMIAPQTDATPADRARQRRPIRPLLGLLRCGACGSGMSVKGKGKDKSGRPRIGCTQHMQSKTCPAPRTWYLDIIEEHVVGLLRREIDNPAMLDLYGASTTKPASNTP